MPDKVAIRPFSYLHCFVFTGVRHAEVRRPKDTYGRHKRNLKLQGHDPEVEDLNCGPEDVVGSEGGNVDILELLDNMLLSSSFCECHEGEKSAQADGCEYELVHGDSLERWDGRSLCG